MNQHLLGRRQFNGFCAAVGLSLPTVGTMIGALSGASVLAAEALRRTVRLRNGTALPGDRSGLLASRTGETSGCC